MFLTCRVVQQEVYLRLTRIRRDDFAQLCHHLIVQLIGIHRDGDTLDGTFLNRLQILHILHLQLHDVTILEAGLNLGGDIDRRALDEHTAPTSPVLTKQSQLTGTLEILQHDKATGIATLVETGAHTGHDAADDDILTVFQLVDIRQLVAPGVAEVVEHNLIFVQRMGREIDTHQFAFLVQTLDIAPAFVGLGNSRTLYFHIVETTKERVLGLLLLGLIGLAKAHDNINERLTLTILGKEVLTADAKRVEATTEGQCLKGLAVDLSEIDTLHKVVDILVESVLLAFVDDSLCHSIAHTLDGCQAKTDLTMLVNTEFLVRLVDIRSQRCDTHLLALVHQLGNLRDLVATTTHNGSHELSRIVGLEVRRLVGHP